MPLEAAFSVALLAYAIVCFIRIELVYRWNMAAISMAHDRSVEMIDNNIDGWMRVYEIVMKEQREVLVFVFFRWSEWSFKDYHPDLEKRLKSLS